MEQKEMLEQMYSQLIDNLRMYHPAANDNSLVRKGFEVAVQAHEGQKRKSGEPFVIHPITVALILSELHLDKETIIAALLHDVVEDTAWTNEDIKREFGEEICFLVDGVTKLTKMSSGASKTEMKMESFRKLMLATASDIRVIIIKLADRLHNMRTLQHQPPNKQIEISTETMDLYSPIAQRLGISVLSTELEDLSFSYLFPQEYRQMQEKLAEMQRDEKMDQILSEIYKEFTSAGFHFQMRYERKHLFSIYRKMVNRQKTLDEMYDISAVKIIVNSVRDCYLVLGTLHHLYKPVPNRFKDYIALPKENMYQSLHTTLISKGGKRFEVQIKTQEMDRTARYGVLATWKYDDKSSSAKEIGRSQSEKARWLKQILEWQQDITNNTEFIDLVKDDFNLFSESISCFTPAGDVKRLQKGSTVVDFAYAVHSDIGNHMFGAYVNSVRKTPDYILQDGDSVEILLQENASGPKQEWLAFVKTGNARSKIKKYFRDHAELTMDYLKASLTSFEKNKAVTLKIFMKPGGEFLLFESAYRYFIKKKLLPERFSYVEKSHLLEIALRLKEERLGRILDEIGVLPFVDRVELVHG